MELTTTTFANNEISAALVANAFVTVPQLEDVRLDALLLRNLGHELHRMRHVEGYYTGDFECLMPQQVRDVLYNCRAQLLKNATLFNDIVLRKEPRPLAITEGLIPTGATFRTHAGPKPRKSKAQTE